MIKRIGALALSMMLLLAYAAPASAARLGPATTYDELLALASEAKDGDVLLVRGTLAADSAQPLSPAASVRIASDSGKSTIEGLALRDASVAFSDVTLKDSLRVEGSSYIQLSDGVSVVGAQGASGIVFSGNGALMLDGGSTVTGGGEASGVHIHHDGGELYISLDGSVRGGTGVSGGAGVTIDPLRDGGALMITGKLTGGSGDTFGGNALNLYNIDGNAFVTVDGTLTGGTGSIGGSGMQLITAEGSSTIGIGGQISGGQGRDFGGDALLLMNVSGAASVMLSGSLTGGNASGTDSTPGQSLQILGQHTSLHTRIGDCILQDGKQILVSSAVTPLPAITSSVNDMQTLVTPEPTPSSSPEPTTAPTSEPMPEPTSEPTAAPTDAPTAAPTPKPTAEPTANPTDAPTTEPTAAPTAEPTTEPTILTPSEAQNAG